VPQFGHAQGHGFLFVNDFVASPNHQGIGTVAGSIGRIKLVAQRVQNQFFDGFLSRPLLTISEGSFGSGTLRKRSDFTLTNFSVFGLLTSL